MRVRIRIGLATAAMAFVVTLATTQVSVVGQSSPPRPPAPTAPAAVDAQAVLKQYCVTCHNERQRRAGAVPISLDGINVADLTADAETWEKVVRKMSAGVMPPVGMPRQSESARRAFVGWVEGELDRASRANVNPGRTEPLHRLNRVQYANAVRDLLDLEVDVAGLLPSDDASYGFDNIAGVL